MRQVGGFLRFPQPIKLPPRYNWNIVESGVKQINLTLYFIHIIILFYVQYLKHPHRLQNNGYRALKTKYITPKDIQLVCVASLLSTQHRGERLESNKYQFYYLWIDPTWARTHDLSLPMRAHQPLHHRCGSFWWRHISRWIRWHTKYGVLHKIFLANSWFKFLHSSISMYAFSSPWL